MTDDMTTAEDKRWVTFEFKGKPGSEVFVAGVFNEWSPQQEKLKDEDGEGTYTIRLLLAPGRYEYKFIVDGTWCADPTCADFTSDGCGGINSVACVGEELAEGDASS